MGKVPFDSLQILFGSIIDGQIYHCVETFRVVSTPTDRRLLALCGISAFVGVPTGIWIFPNRGIMILVVPIIVLSVLMFVDGFLTSA